MTVRDGLLELNGKPIELRGASIQEDIDGHGPALTDADVDAIVAQLKAVGANVTRAHYALDERLQRKLDEAGIMVWTQAPIYHRDKLLVSETQRDAALSTVRAAVIATRNHPSTITHSVANELSVIPDKVAGTAAFLRDARARHGRSRPDAAHLRRHAQLPGLRARESYAAFDLLGINSYFGWYPEQARPLDRRHPLARPIPHGHARDVPQRRPGADRVRRRGDDDGAGQHREATMLLPAGLHARRAHPPCSRAPTLSGAILLDALQEFAVKLHVGQGRAAARQADRTSIHHKGLITYDGRPKPAYDALRKDIKSTPLVRPEADVALALDTRVPERHRGRVGLGFKRSRDPGLLSAPCS